MAQDIATKANWFINSASQGNKRLARVKDYDISDGASKEADTEVGSDDPVGFTRKPGPKTITFNCRQTKGAKPDVDWEKLAEGDEVFSLTMQVTGGRRVQFPRVQCSKVDFSGDDQGELTYSVECIALARKSL
jgi:hypothetical protein